MRRPRLPRISTYRVAKILVNTALAIHRFGDWRHHHWYKRNRCEKVREDGARCILTKNQHEYYVKFPKSFTKPIEHMFYEDRDHETIEGKSRPYHLAILETPGRSQNPATPDFLFHAWRHSKFLPVSIVFEDENLAGHRVVAWVTENDAWVFPQEERNLIKRD